MESFLLFTCTLKRLRQTRKTQATWAEQKASTSKERRSVDHGLSECSGVWKVTQTSFVYAHMCVFAVHVWRSRDNLLRLVFASSYLNSNVGTQIVGCLYLLNHVTGP